MSGDPREWGSPWRFEGGGGVPLRELIQPAAHSQIFLVDCAVERTRCVRTRPQGDRVAPLLPQLVHTHACTCVNTFNTYTQSHILQILQKRKAADLFSLCS